MNKTVKIWLEDLINKEIDDVRGNIENRKIWLLRSSDKEAIQIQLDNLCLDSDYLAALKSYQESYRERRPLIPSENLHEKSR